MSDEREALYNLLVGSVEAQYGLKVKSNNAEGLRNRLHGLRYELQEAEDFSFDNLKMRISPDDPQELWIINK